MNLKQKIAVRITDEIAAKIEGWANKRGPELLELKRRAADRPELLRVIDEFATCTEMLIKLRELELNTRTEVARTKEDLQAFTGQLRTAIAERDRLAAERPALIEQVRVMTTERDPERVARVVEAAVSAATRDRDATIAQLRSELVEAHRETAELRTAKRRLREALERAKDGRS